MQELRAPNFIEQKEEAERFQMIQLRALRVLWEVATYRKIAQTLIIDFKYASGKLTRPSPTRFVP